jgi:hypothetical protein
MFVGGPDYSSCEAKGFTDTSTADEHILVGACTDCSSVGHTFLIKLDSNLNQLGDYRLVEGYSNQMDCLFDAVTGSSDGYLFCVVSSDTAIELWKVQESDLAILEHQ